MSQVFWVLTIEQVFLKLILNNIKIILGCIYTPPFSSCDVYSKHCEVIEFIYLMYLKYNYVITGGDFNLNQFDWSINPTTQDHNTGSLIFNSYLNYLNLKQINHIILNFNCSGRTFDCVMISADVELTNILHLLESLVPIIDNYHTPLDFIIQFNIALVNKHFESPLIKNK